MESMLICDLDGTLVDSYPGIAQALRSACQKNRVESRRQIGHWVVGPTLDEILLQVVGHNDRNAIADLRASFEAEYDIGACMLSTPFQGVAKMLADVSYAGHTLVLATNKRLAPTATILNTLGWMHYFQSVETPDSQPGPLRKKTQMLTAIRSAAPAVDAPVVYLGDTIADVAHAAEAGVSFILALWGCEPISMPPRTRVARHPCEVTSILSGISI